MRGDVRSIRNYNEACHSVRSNLSGSFLLINRSATISEPTRRLRSLVLNFRSNDIHLNCRPQLLEHYHFQLRFYFGVTTLQTAGHEMTEDLLSQAVQVSPQDQVVRTCRFSCFPKIISASDVPAVRGIPVRRVVVLVWLRRTAQDCYFRKLGSCRHTTIGSDARLFFFLRKVPDALVWWPLGLGLISSLKRYVRLKLVGSHYNEVATPLLLPMHFWQRSGHAEHYNKNMLNAVGDIVSFALKPMNCIGHICAFKQSPRSFRDLPLRYAEFGICHRKESSGSVCGLLRGRSFTQDDGHIFCSRSQVQSEVETLHRTMVNTYTTFGFTAVQVKLSYPSAFQFGWAVGILRSVLSAAGVLFDELPGDGAFYGAKVEYHLKDSIGHLWQCGTFQLDETLPQTMNLTFAESDGTIGRPVILHRAMLGSLERFLGILLENQVVLPFWFSPIKVILLPAGKIPGSWQLVCQMLRKVGAFPDSDSSQSSLGHKIHRHSSRKIPFLVLIGQRECCCAALSVRMHHPQCHRTLTLESFTYLVRMKAQQQENEVTL